MKKRNGKKRRKRKKKSGENGGKRQEKRQEKRKKSEIEKRKIRAYPRFSYSPFLCHICIFLIFGFVYFRDQSK